MFQWLVDEAIVVVMSLETYCHIYPNNRWVQVSRSQYLGETNINLYMVSDLVIHFAYHISLAFGNLSQFLGTETIFIGKFLIQINFLIPIIERDQAILKTNYPELEILTKFQFFENMSQTLATQTLFMGS